ncbi:MAG: NAD(P)-dependent oxidoreductase [Pseudomonadota bacterium]
MARPLVVKAGTEDPDPVSGISYPIPKCLAALRTRCDVVVTDDEAEETLIEAVQGASILMITYGQVTARVLAAGQPTLKAVIKMGTGIDSIDFEAAKSLGVRVANCPGYAEYAVAECAFLLMINAFKKFPEISGGMAASGWIGPTEANKGLELFGKTVGLVGFGHINRRLNQMCQGFGMQVHVYDPYVPQMDIEAAGGSKVEDLLDLAKMADALAICVPLNPETDGLISRNILAAMKRTAFLINVGRGATVDEAALVDALETRGIAGCGLDVYSQEPLMRTDHPMSRLLDMPNAVLFPHLAAWTSDTWDRLQDEVTAHVMDVLGNRPLTIRSRDPRLAGQVGCYYA